MRHESKFSSWIRSGGQGTFVLPLTSLVNLECKFSVVPDRLLDSIMDDALVSAVSRLNQYLPSGVSVDISAVDLTPTRIATAMAILKAVTGGGFVGAA